MPGTGAKKRASQYSQRSLSIVEADTRQITFIAFATKVVSEKFNVLPFLSTSYQAVQHWTGIMILLTAAESILLASILVFFARGPHVQARRRRTDERIYDRTDGCIWQHGYVDGLWSPDQHEHCQQNWTYPATAGVWVEELPGQKTSYDRQGNVIQKIHQWPSG